MKSSNKFLLPNFSGWRYSECPLRILQCWVIFDSEHFHWLPLSGHVILSHYLWNLCKLWPTFSARQLRYKHLLLHWLFFKWHFPWVTGHPARSQSIELVHVIHLPVSCRHIFLEEPRTLLIFSYIFELWSSQYCPRELHASLFLLLSFFPSCTSIMCVHANAC